MVALGRVGGSYERGTPVHVQATLTGHLGDTSKARSLPRGCLYRGTLLIRSSLPLGPYSRTMPRACTCMVVLRGGGCSVRARCHCNLCWLPRTRFNHLEPFTRAGCSPCVPFLSEFYDAPHCRDIRGYITCNRKAPAKLTWYEANRGAVPCLVVI